MLRWSFDEASKGFKRFSLFSPNLCYPSAHRASPRCCIAPFTHVVASDYGARIIDREIARRVSFLIGLDGKLTHVTDAPSADTHLSEMKEAVAKLK